MTFEQMLAIGAISGAFGGAGAYGLNVIIVNTLAHLDHKRAKRAFAEYVADPKNVEDLKSRLRKASEDAEKQIERGELR